MKMEVKEKVLEVRRNCNDLEGLEILDVLEELVVQNFVLGEDCCGEDNNYLSLSWKRQRKAKFWTSCAVK